MSHSNTYDIIVVGAGISGLALAYKLAKSDKKVLVLEAGKRVGGCLHTHYNGQNDFWAEMGAHTFYATYANIIEVLESSGLAQDIEPRQKVAIKVFAGKHEKVFAPVNKWALITSIPNLFFSKRDGKTVKEYFSKIVGKRNYKNVFSRMFSAVIVQNADNFSAEFFLKRRKTKNKNYPKSFTLKKGMQSFMEHLAKTENLEVLTNQKVVSVEKTHETVVKTEQGKEFAARNIAFGISPKEVSNLVSGINPKLAEKLNEFPIQNIISRGILLPKEKAGIDPASFVIPLQGPCFSVVTRDVLPHESLRGFACHFQEEHTTREQQIEIMSELIKVEKQDLNKTFEANHTLPLLKLGHKERIQEIQELTEHSGIYLTGNYFNGLSLEDCVERSKSEFERYMRNNG